MAAQSLPEPPSSQPIRNFDVFLSTGKDTRKNFTDHLRNALIKAEINIFINDEELYRDNEITSLLLNVIEESRISILIFSEDYASSTWCLDQLVKIMECKKSIGQTVIPIYYHVHPSDVRNQISTFANAFAWHEDDTELERKRKWRAALEEAGNLFGFDFANGSEAKLIEQIVKEISKKVKLPIVQSLPRPPSSQPIRNYDVILNYRGSDTRMNFTDHLYTALKKVGIYTFIDDEGLERGMEIFPKILKAIEISRMSIVVFSKGYASSSWCLDELVKIVECRNSKGQAVFPIFYDVDPSDVQNQTSSFAIAFAQHERWVDVARVKKWRKALQDVATFSGHVATGFASKHIEEIVEKISKEVRQPLRWGLSDIGADGRRIGKLFVSNKKIAEGSRGTIVFEGRYHGRQVAVKRLVKYHNDVASKEIEILTRSDQHTNIVRYYGKEQEQGFVYLILERYTCSLDDLIQIYFDPIYMTKYKAHLESIKDSMLNLNLWKANGHPSPLLLKVMRDVVSGLEHLHGLKIFHEDLKPQNVLIINEIKENREISLRTKLSGDFATGCAANLFSLGRVLFFCITGGKDPFGDGNKRVSNIEESKMDLSLVKKIPEADHLISCLLNPGTNLRPTALEVLHHPLFWSSNKRLSFLRDASDMVEREAKKRKARKRKAGKSDSDLLTALDNIALGAKWKEKMGSAFIDHISSDSYREYKFDSIRDLLRLIRNKFSHYRDLPEEIQEHLGSNPEGYDDYFASRFPRLLIDVYEVVSRYCTEEEGFQEYRLSEVFQKQC